MFKHGAVRSSLLASAVAVALLVTAGQATARAAESGTVVGPAAATATATFSFGAPAVNPFDEVDRLAAAQEHAPAPAPGGTAPTGQVPGAATPAIAPAYTALVQRAAVYVGSRAAVLREAGDLLVPEAEGVIGPGRITGTLADIVYARIPAGGARGRPQLFKGMGAAWEHLAVAVALFKAAEANGET
ncbi:hypothetical protein [Streptomyces sp. NPDC056061]|uniref:hypothetical protein n=1 Tax=Streptomyces sp. NPDC056061 TaxID=3345700 RepID=UPI0035E16C7F